MLVDLINIKTFSRRQWQDIRVEVDEGIFSLLLKVCLAEEETEMATLAILAQCATTYLYNEHLPLPKEDKKWGVKINHPKKRTSYMEAHHFSLSLPGVGAKT